MNASYEYVLYVRELVYSLSNAAEFKKEEADAYRRCWWSGRCPACGPRITAGHKRYRTVCDALPLILYIYIYIFFFKASGIILRFHNLASCRNFIHNVAVNALLGWSTASVENVCGWLQTVCVMFSRRCGYLDKY